MPAYMEQLNRVRRMLERINRNQNRSADDYGDDVWSFFQNCWHLKDWIKNDPHIPIHGSIEDLVKTSPPLMICADLANGTKHLKFDRPPRVSLLCEYHSIVQCNMRCGPLGEVSQVGHLRSLTQLP